MFFFFFLFDPFPQLILIICSYLSSRRTSIIFMSLILLFFSFMTGQLVS